MGMMLGLVTCTVSIKSVSIIGNLSLNEDKLILIKWNVGSFGLALIRATAAVAVAAPTKAEVQLHFTFLPMNEFWRELLSSSSPLLEMRGR